MKDIFTDLYNKVLGFFRQTDKKEENAKEVACNRLRVVLMQDRTNLSPELMERMRQELVDLLSKYVEMDKEALELNFEQEGNQMALMLSIPVLRAKEESEIEKELAKQDAAKEALEKETAEKEEANKDSENSEEEIVEIVESADSDEFTNPEIQEGSGTEVEDIGIIEIVEPESEQEEVKE